MPIEFRILGPLELSVDGRLLPLGSRSRLPNNVIR
jgi:hypothetical protein